MTDDPDRTLGLSALLEAVQAASPVDAVDVVATELGRMVDAADVSFLIADFSGNAVIRLVTKPIAPGLGRQEAVAAGTDSIALEGTAYERVIRSQLLHVDMEPDQWRVYAPVTERGDALGVLELTLRELPDAAVLTFISAVAHALAYVIIVNRRHTDVFERGQRGVPFTLAAEMQRRLLPDPFTCEAAEFTVAGWLEPASSVGGDTFDYCLERDALHLSVSDAMGHTVNAAQLATLAVGSLRNSRRSRASVVGQAQAANSALVVHTQPEDFVSALLMRVDLRTGFVAAVNAGQPLPFLVRGGVVTAVPLVPELPFGMFREATYTRQSFELQPGDRVVLVTDGMLERNASGLDVAAALTDMADLHPREVVHHFAQAVLGATGGELQDDATILCVDWYGPSPDGDRESNAGASQSLASAAAPGEGPRDF